MRLQVDLGIYIKIYVIFHFIYAVRIHTHTAFNYTLCTLHWCVCVCVRMTQICQFVNYFWKIIIKMAAQEWMTNDIRDTHNCQWKNSYSNNNIVVTTTTQQHRYWYSTVCQTIPTTTTAANRVVKSVNVCVLQLKWLCEPIAHCWTFKSCCYVGFYPSKQAILNGRPILSWNSIRICRYSEKTIRNGSRKKRPQFGNDFACGRSFSKFRMTGKQRHMCFVRLKLFTHWHGQWLERKKMLISINGCVHAQCAHMRIYWDLNDINYECVCVLFLWFFKRYHFVRSILMALSSLWQSVDFYIGSAEFFHHIKMKGKKAESTFNQLNGTVCEVDMCTSSSDSATGWNIARERVEKIRSEKWK